MQTVQVKLLNDGGFGCSHNVKFPVVIDDCKVFSKGVLIRVDKLMESGFNFDIIGDTTEDLELFFSIRHGECEVVS